jgi:hypothetical protein
MSKLEINPAELQAQYITAISPWLYTPDTFKNKLYYCSHIFFMTQHPGNDNIPVAWWYKLEGIWGLLSIERKSYVLFYI